MVKPSTLLVTGGLALLAGAAQAQLFTFAQVATYNSGVNSQPRGLAVADVNGDGKQDVLTASQGTYAVGVLLGNGNGTFRAVSTTSQTEGSVAVADVNGDGKLDLLTTSSSNAAAVVALGNGDGTFQAPNNYFAGNAAVPVTIAAADVNGDGKPDLLTANYTANNVTVLLGTGTGKFPAYSTYSAGSTSAPYHLAVADVNGDGKPDLLTANFGNNTAGVLLNSGTGTFLVAKTYATGSRTTGIAVADVNGDGKPDLLTANNTSGMTVLLGNGDGTFQAFTSYVTGGVTDRLAVADVNADGKLDVLAASNAGTTVGLLLGKGNGTFQTAIPYVAGTNSQPNDVAIADLNGDGKPDLLTANYGSSTVGVLLNTSVLATRATLPGATATLHPNPATATAATLSLAGLPAAVAQVQAILLDATGRAVCQQVLAATQGSARAEVPTAGLAPGLYVLRLAALNVQGQPAGNLPTQRLSVR